MAMIVFIKKNNGTHLKLQNRFFMHMKLRKYDLIKYCFQNSNSERTKICLRESLKLPLMPLKSNTPHLALDFSLGLIRIVVSHTSSYKLSSK